MIYMTGKANPHIDRYLHIQNLGLHISAAKMYTSYTNINVLIKLHMVRLSRIYTETVFFCFVLWTILVCAQG